MVTLTPTTMVGTLHLSLSSQTSNLFGPRVSNFTSFRPNLIPLRTTLPTSVSARFGGGGGRGGSASRSGGRRPPRQQMNTPNEDDDALDISSIRSTTVRLIDQNQSMVGVLSKSEAIQMADAAGLDLVILSPEAEPPVVRIMDYSKYRYEQQKKKRDQMKKSAAGRVEQKELKMGYNIDNHDYDVRLRAANRFRKMETRHAMQVKLMVQLKGRENEFRNKAIELIRRFQKDVGELAVEESKNFSDRNMNIVLVPNKVLAQKAQEVPKKEAEAGNQVSTSV